MGGFNDIDGFDIAFAKDIPYSNGMNNCGYLSHSPKRRRLGKHWRESGDGKNKPQQQYLEQ